jgi:hypothetical protein
MNRLLQLTGAITCLLAVLMASGGHWAVLQSIAWAQMLVKYSRDASLSEAVTKTFDGKHPCKMCLKIQECRKQEKRQPPLVKWEKLPEFLLDLRPVAVPAPALRDADFAAFLSNPHSDLVMAPPKPPPRLFAV